MTVATLVERALVLEEEHQPLPDEPSPALLVTRVVERLGRAATADTPLDVAVALLGASSFALTAISRLDPEGDVRRRCELKRGLVRRLDVEVAGRKADAGESVETALGRLGSACECVVRLEEADTPEERCELLERACESLWQTAVTAAAAAQRFSGFAYSNRQPASRAAGSATFCRSTSGS